MMIYKSLVEMLPITDNYQFNWECKNKGCWDGPCFTQHEKKPRVCPSFGRPLIGDPEPKWIRIREVKRK
jgi:hypothetical protein